MKETHKQRIKKILERAGGKGVHSFDLNDWVSPRAAARINELRKKGCEITSTHEKRGCAYGVRYTLQG